MINQKAAAVRFGAVMHATLKKYVYEDENPHPYFFDYWLKYKGVAEYAAGETWEGFNAIGRTLLSEFVLQYPEYGLTPILAENGGKVRSGCSIVRPDLIAEDRDGRYVVVDYKITKAPVWWDDIRNQMIKGAMLVRQEFNTEADIRAIVCNMVRDTGTIIWDDRLITTADIDALIEDMDSLEDVLDG